MTMVNSGSKGLNEYEINPLSPHDAFKHFFYIPENKQNFPTAKSFRIKISMRLVYQYMAFFFNFSPSSTCSSHFHPLQIRGL